MTSSRRAGLIWVLLCSGISVLWGTSVARGGNAWVDFRAVYAGTRCLLDHHNPYSVPDLEREYLSEGGQRLAYDPHYFFQAVTLYVNVPTTFVVVAPFALLPWGLAHVLWMLLTGSVLILAIVLMWSVGAERAPRLSALLACILAVNCETIFGAGNTAGLVVGLCVIAVWCFIRNRYAAIGVLCMGLSLAVKPHDAGFVWLFFLLAGATERKRALQSLSICCAISLAAVAWVWSIAPHWNADWQANLARISARGGINEPGPQSLMGRSSSMVVDLQAAISVFRDDPRFYDAVSYAVCGALLLVWLAWTLRSRFSVSRAWIGLAAVTALTMLVTYHRPWDAKLVMLAIPACCFLWAAGGKTGKIAAAVTAAAVVCTGDIALALLSMLSHFLNVSTARTFGQIVTVMLIRPGSLALLAMGVFYLWCYLRQADVEPNNGVLPDRHAAPTRVSS